MSDSTTNAFVASVADAAARAAFTPSPPTPASGPAQGYTLYQRDTDTLYSWDSGSASWVAPTAGTVNLATGVTGVLPVANGGTGVSSAFVPLLKSTTTLTDAQIKALPTTGITIVSAPSAGSRIRIMAVSLSIHASAGAYTNINATYADITLFCGGNSVGYAPVNDSSTSPALTGVTDVFGTTTPLVYDIPIPNVAAVGTSPSYVLPLNVFSHSTLSAAAVTIKADNNGSGNFTGGNAANTLVVTAYYTVEAF